MSQLDLLFPQLRVSGNTDPEGRHWLGVIARKSYELVDGSRATSLPRAPTPSAEGPTLMGLAEADDLSLIKPSTDVILTGTISGDRKARSMDTLLSIGNLEKEVRVHGRRTVERRKQGLAISETAPIESVVLDWSQAFGGKDPAPERSPRAQPPRDVVVDLPIYPRNPFGIGYRVGGGNARLVDMQLPSLEDPRDPITLEGLIPRAHELWPSRPSAAGYGPVHRFAFPRLQHYFNHHDDALGPEESRMEIRRWLQCAAPGLGHALLRGDERITLSGFWPHGRQLVTALPADVPEMSIDIPGVGRRRLEPRLKTVLIELDQGRVTTTWAGALEALSEYDAEALETVRGNVRFANAA